VFSLIFPRKIFRLQKFEGSLCLGDINETGRFVAGLFYHYILDHSINQSVSNVLEWPKQHATARTTVGVTVKKCHMIMSGNDCWNSVCFSC